MGYDVESAEKSKDYSGSDGTVMFTSKTLVGLNEEIDRFVKEKKPKRLTRHQEGPGSPIVTHYDLGELVPEYWHEDDEDDLKWYLVMYAEGMVHN